MSRSAVLSIIVLAQFACTSLWFAGNAVLPELMNTYGYDPTALGHITSAVQLGFIAGTFIFALLSIADRYSPSKVFLVSAILGGAFNLAVIGLAENFAALLGLRFMTGFFLAGIYPVGMKIAADWHEKGLGKALGFLVGALVLGTAFPHLVQFGLADYSWSNVLITTSGFAFTGGLAIGLFVPDGPFRKKGKGIDLTAALKVFGNRDFRAAAFGYFGHMWELYAFWAFVPVIIALYNEQSGASLSVPLISFIMIASGAISCVIGGYISLSKGSLKVAFGALLISGTCCLLSPFITHLVLPAFLIFLLIWSMSVIADSPQFSTLVAQTAPLEIKGTALTIVNCIGFAITIVSIQMLNYFQDVGFKPEYLMLLVFGPIFGLAALRNARKRIYA